MMTLSSGAVGDRANAARALIDTGQLDAAIRDLTSAASESPADPELRYLLGVAMFRTGDFTNSEQQFRQAIAHRPGDHLATYYVGLCLERRGHKDEAVAAYRASLALEPRFQSAKDKLAELDPSIAPSATAIDEPPAQRLTDLVIPQTDEELQNYTEWRRKKERADWTIEHWHSVPWPVRLIQITAGLAVVAFIVVMFVLVVPTVLEGFGDS